MSNTSGQGGFTIVETIIVLAVTTGMFLAAVFLVAGQQNKVQFAQGVQDIQQIIQQKINEVGTGYYSNTDNFECDGGGGNLDIRQASSNNQGTNTGCIFLGKAMQFGVANTDPQEYVTYTIAGLQNNTGTLASARPIAIAPGLTTNTAGNFPDASVHSALRSGLTAVRMQYVVGATKTNIGAVAFVSGLGQYNGTELLSGAQQVSLVPVLGSGSLDPLTTTPASVVDRINTALALSPVNPSGGIEICFASGSTNQSGLVTIGSNGRNLSVNLQIRDGRNC